MSESRLQVNCGMGWLNIWEIWQWLWENCPKLLSEPQHNLQTRPQFFSESEPYHHCKQSTKLGDNNSVYDAFLVSLWLANLKTLENKTPGAEVTFCNWPIRGLHFNFCPIRGHILQPMRQMTSWLELYHSHVWARVSAWDPRSGVLSGVSRHHPGVTESPLLSLMSLMT